MNWEECEIERYRYNCTGIYLEGQRQRVKNLTVTGLEADISWIGNNSAAHLSQYSAVTVNSGSVRILNLWLICMRVLVYTYGLLWIRPVGRPVLTN